MTDQQRDPDPADLETVETIAALQGDALPIDQDAVLEPDEIEGVRQPTRTELDQGDPVRGPDDTVDAEDLEVFADRGLREGETDDPGVAAQEGMPWVPPTDPPGFDDDHRETEGIDELDVTERIRAAIHGDAATTDLVDQVAVITRGSTAIVRGTVTTLFDADALVTVIERVEGIDEVVDETELAD